MHGQGGWAGRGGGCTLSSGRRDSRTVVRSGCAVSSQGVSGAVSGDGANRSAPPTTDHRALVSSASGRVGRCGACACAVRAPRALSTHICIASLSCHIAPMARWHKPIPMADRWPMYGVWLCMARWLWLYDSR
eukprot:scaffold29558_cov146-Isochrysis_galbana.AAC.3